MVSIFVHNSRELAAALHPSCPHIVLVLDNPHSVYILKEAEVEGLVKAKSEADLQLISSVASSLTPCSDSAKKAECYISGDDLVKVSIVMMPSECSRHNTPSRAHALGAAVKDLKTSKNMLVVLLLASDALAFGQICAVGRQFPPFSMKSGEGQGSQEVHIVAHFSVNNEANNEAVRCAGIVIENIRMAQRLVDTPPNILHSDAYIQHCKEVSRAVGASMKVIQGRELEEEGFGGIWGVGKAAEHLPALVVLSYIPSEATGPSVCLVGKGIIYDTGGLSIKTPGSSMVGMKTDMAGSAAVLGAFASAVGSGKLRRPLHALLCIAENSVGPISTRPDDIHRLLSGKTVEINNTDAEGRLVLSDGVYYAHKQLNPSVIVDIATLTGAQLIATGKKHAAIYCSHDALEACAVEAGKYTGDLTFPIPYCPELFRQEFRSSVADMKNSVADRGNAQSSCAGQFIGNHLEEYLAQEGKQWLHVDMAGPATVGDRATGYGVALLFDLVNRLNT